MIVVFSFFNLFQVDSCVRCVIRFVCRGQVVDGLCSRMESVLQHLVPVTDMSVVEIVDGVLFLIGVVWSCFWNVINRILQKGFDECVSIIGNECRERGFVFLKLEEPDHVFVNEFRWIVSFALFCGHVVGFIVENVCCWREFCLNMARTNNSLNHIA